MTARRTKMSPGQMHPNNWNPNQMEPEQFQAYVKEVKRLGRIPKPIVLRADEDEYEIIDGEHAWRAAQEVGLREVEVEIIDADGYESRMQTFKRNQSGEHCPVREGRMFGEMLAERDLSGRALADELGVSEGTVRNRLKAAEAADRRAEHVEGREQADAEIGDLTGDERNLYLSLSTPIADLWMDAGAGREILLQGLPETYRQAAEELGGLHIEEIVAGCKALFDRTLIPELPPVNDPRGFVRAMRLLYLWTGVRRDWCTGQLTWERLWPYVRPFRRKPADFLKYYEVNHALKVLVNTKGQAPPSFGIGPDAFHDVVERTEKPFSLGFSVADAIEKETGMRPGCKPDSQHYIWKSQIAEEGPGYLRKSDLPVRWRHWIRVCSEEWSREDDVCVDAACRELARKDGFEKDRRESDYAAIRREVQRRARRIARRRRWEETSAEDHREAIARSVYGSEEDLRAEFAANLGSMAQRHLIALRERFSNR